MHINHVQISASDLSGSIQFYRGLLGATPIPTPEFAVPVQWLRVGSCQLHISERASQPSSHQHFALTVDDLVAPYRYAVENRAFDSTAFGHHLFQLPGDVAQMYVRDPAGNLVELDAANASRLPDELRADWKVFEEFRLQTRDISDAILYVRGTE
jgi:catechol 2,3-dioxygenase-like lactoylglutathione lyase family enzyme